MTRISKYAAAAVFTGALALAAATPSQARWHGGHGWHNGAGAAIGFGVGALVGAAAANAAYPDYYGYDDGYAPGYAGAYAYEPESTYYGSRYNYDRRDRNGRDCTLSPASVNYVPCDNQ